VSASETRVNALVASPGPQNTARHNAPQQWAQWARFGTLASLILIGDEKAAI
jgi:hypothetical protein